jgi:hypothetical protein
MALWWSRSNWRNQPPYGKVGARKLWRTKGAQVVYFVRQAGRLLGTASLAVRGIPTAPLGSSLLLMIRNTERPPWRRPRKPPNLSHCPREIVPEVGGGGRYECTRRNFGEVLRSRYRRRRGLCDRHLRVRLAVRRRQAIDMQARWVDRPDTRGIMGKTVGARA